MRQGREERFLACGKRAAATFGSESQKTSRKTERLCAGEGKLWSEEKEVPEDVYGGVDDGGGEDRTGFAPGPSVEESGDGG